MTGPDVQMDQHGSSYDPANRLPAKCRRCSFPDLDFVPQPYFLTKGVSSPAEISPAQMGNFLVRKRVRDILDLVLRQSCAFYPTLEKKSGKPTDWLLAVPKHLIELPGLKPQNPFCPECHEPKTGHTTTDHGAHIARLKEFDSHGVDIFKSQEWYSIGTAEDNFDAVNRCRKEEGEPPLSWKEFIHWAIPGLEPPTQPGRWTRRHLSRRLFFSVRLEQFLKRMKVKGQLVRSYDFKELRPSAEDERWIEGKLLLLDDRPLGAAVKPRETGKAGNWFKEFLKGNARSGLKPVSFAMVEQKQRIMLPQAYKDFILAVGSKDFTDVCRLEGSTTRVLLPQKLDFKDYRRGKVPYLEGEQAEVDGVMFAEVDNGDCFVFDVSAGTGNYPIYWYKHEENELEPFAAGFPECIKRFSQKN
ncbi:MAG: SMI1/KNR4 family protein [Verrucomicrobiales bacterium]|nr:SMI1/KNR4 family protein [Verrucomicrobiales bacterium]